VSETNLRVHTRVPLLGLSGNRVLYSESGIRFLLRVNSRAFAVKFLAWERGLSLLNLRRSAACLAVAFVILDSRSLFGEGGFICG
jgi:hypothetical protein